MVLRGELFGRCRVNGQPLVAIGLTNKTIELIGEFHRKYPGTRQGIISYFEILFGDPSGFNYSTVMERESFYRDPAFNTALLNRLHIQVGMPLNEIRNTLAVVGSNGTSSCVGRVELFSLNERTV